MSENHQTRKAVERLAKSNDSYNGSELFKSLYKCVKSIRPKMGKRIQMKNILIALMLFAATITAQEFKVTFLPNGKVMVKPDIPSRHTGTFTYFIAWDSDELYIEEMFQTHSEAVKYVNQYKHSHDYRVIIAPNVF